MEERELRITYGMAFKLAGDVVAKQDLSTLTGDQIVEEISDLAEALTHAALGGQEKIVSAYSHLITETPKKSWSKSNGGSSRAGSGSRSSAKGPKNPSAPASEKQVALATKLYWTKDHDLEENPDSFSDMTMGEISKIIDELIASG